MTDEITDKTEHTVLGVRMTTEQRDRIREAARIEDRTESSFARFYLSKAADAVIELETPTEAQP